MNDSSETWMTTTRFLFSRTVGMALAALVFGAVGPAHAVVLNPVNSTGDAGDATPGNGVCATAGGVCTLRAAIQEANALAGADTIPFNIGGGGPQTIVLASSLPPITSPVTIDGTTQPGWVNAAPFAPIIELNGAAALQVIDLQGASSSGSTIRGLAINRTTGGDGIRIQASSNNVIAGNFIGTNLAGTAALGNLVGIDMAAGAGVANNNRIGGTAAADRNLMSGSIIDGLQINGLGGGGTANNLVQGNYIGLDVTGTVDLGNTNQGISQFGVNSNNLIGGTAAGAGNVISGNGGNGLHIHDVGNTSTRVQGNKIGTNAAGTAPLPNGGDGVRLYISTVNNTIGGTAAGAGNIIAFNGGNGVRLLASSGNGNSILGNSIHSNTLLGIDLNDDGVSPNDGGDGDAGPNGRLNFPVITSAYENSGTLTVNFSIDVPIAPLASYRIEFFKNPSGADLTGFGEGQVFAGSRNITQPSAGPNSFSLSFAGSVGDRISATTTECTDGAACMAFGSSSEFAQTFSATTAVKLMSFTAVPADSAADLAWQTGTEMENLGFNLYRSSSPDGPFARITSSLVPGLGNSPEGARYAYRDSGLRNGTTYHYLLEDVETTGRTERHGPVTARPMAPAQDADQPDPAGGSVSGSGSSGSARIAYGDPSGSSFRILSRSSTGMVVELRTGGFQATPLEGGFVRLEIPSFAHGAQPGQPDLPVFRTWIEAVAGRKVTLESIRPGEITTFSNLRPQDAPASDVEVSADGTVRAVQRQVQSLFRSGQGLLPAEPARLLQTAFQGETKKAFLEIAPLRYDSSTGQLLLARTLTVRVSFLGREPDEVALGGPRGRRVQPLSARLRTNGLLARFGVDAPGLYAVSFADVFGTGRRSVPVHTLRLSRQGQSVAFHTEPSTSLFGPGSTLFFVSDGSDVNPWANEAVYELARAASSLTMPIADASPTGTAVLEYSRHDRVEQNKLYQAALLDAPSLWLWEYVLSPATRTYPFQVSSLATSGTPARLTVYLQGGSDFEANPDHHVRIRVNGTEVAEASWDGKLPRIVQAEVSSGVLLEGGNLLEVQNVGDTGASYSLVILDRFTVDYPRQTVAVSGGLEGAFLATGATEVSGLGTGTDAVVLDVTEAQPRWLTGAEATPSGLRFRSEAGRRYLAVSSTSVLHPTVKLPTANPLRDASNQADYILIAPREFLEPDPSPARDLLEYRKAQGLSVLGVAVEDVYDQFGYGEVSPQAIKDFLAFAYHRWKQPSPRYVLLLGDTTYDPRNYLQIPNVPRDRIPSLSLKTSFLWTVSDPSFAAVNGDDLIPDLAIGRLSASSLQEAQLLVQKLITFENAALSLDGPAVLVADNPDVAGDFEKDADEIASTLLAGHTVEKIYLGQLGAATRPTILDAFNRGASFMSYLGHGSTVIWASENVLNNMDVPSFQAQAQQPFLLTMNCLNGYFQSPALNSLAEQLVKADGKGAIAAFAPSGLSLNDAAHVYHKALLQEILSGNHPRIGDALLAAQVTYANSGAFPELLSIYHLLGDPAMTVR